MAWCGFFIFILLLSGPVGWFQEGFIVFGSARGHQRGRAYALDHIVSTVTDGTFVRQVYQSVL